MAGLTVAIWADVLSQVARLTLGSVQLPRMALAEAGARCWPAP